MIHRVSFETAAPAAPSPAKTDWAALGSVVGTMLMWGLIPSAVKYLLPFFSITSLNVWRLVIASSLFAITVALLRSWPKLTLKETLMVGLVGFLGTSGFQFAFVNGVAQSPAAISSLVSAINPVWVGLISAMLGERLSGRRWLGIALSVAGMVLISLKTLDPKSGVTLVGLAWLIASSVDWAFFTVLQRPWLRRMTALQFNGVAYALGSLPYVIFGLPDATGSQALGAPPVAWLVLAGIAVAGQYLGFVGWSRGVSAFGPTRTAVFLNLLPVIGLVAAAVLLREPISALAMVATAVTLVGVYLANSR